MHHVSVLERAHNQGYNVDNMMTPEPVFEGSGPPRGTFEGYIKLAAKL